MTLAVIAPVVVKVLLPAKFKVDVPPGNPRLDGGCGQTRRNRIGEGQCFKARNSQRGRRGVASAVSRGTKYKRISAGRRMGQCAS